MAARAWRSTCSASPNASVINLLGDGAIYGNVAIQDGDVISVADGTTYFDGIINPQFLPVGGVTEDVLDSGLFGVGTPDHRRRRQPGARRSAADR